MTKFLNISTDNTLGGSSASDETVSSQKAVKEYVDNQKSWYGTCSTAAETREKVVICDGFTLQTGISIRVKFTYAQTYYGQPRLNVNSTGSINVVLRGATAGIKYMWQDGDVVEFTYDGANWIWERGGIATTIYYGVTKLATNATSTSSSFATTPATINNLVQNMIEPYPVYSTSSTYSVGDRVRYSYQAWECNTAISTAEAWNANHWTALDPLQTQIDNLVAAYTSSEVQTIWDSVS